MSLQDTTTVMAEATPFLKFRLHLPCTPEVVWIPQAPLASAPYSQSPTTASPACVRPILASPSVPGPPSTAWTQDVDLRLLNLEALMISTSWAAVHLLLTCTSQASQTEVSTAKCEALIVWSHPRTLTHITQETACTTKDSIPTRIIRPCSLSTLRLRHRLPLSLSTPTLVRHVDIRPSSAIWEGQQVTTVVDMAAQVLHEAEAGGSAIRHRHPHLNMTPLSTPPKPT